MTPVAFPSAVMKCLERLVKCSKIAESFDPLRFAYRQNRSVSDAVSLLPHTALEHLDKSNIYVRKLFVSSHHVFMDFALCTVVLPCWNGVGTVV